MPDSDVSIRKQLDAICDEFEENWSTDNRSTFEPFLKRVSESHRDQLLLLLVEIDVELRRKKNQPISSSDYQSLGTVAVAHVDKLQSSDTDVTMSASGANSQGKEKTTVRHPQDTDGADRMIGPYKLLQQIGEGGMGSVWMAEQESPVRRRVALKLIRADMGSKETIARFEAERQALAMMDHQNIAKVLDAGTTDDGNPYFVMELVKGIPITQYCDDNTLNIRERLELFIPVCKAIQHAHQKGIIHRDLKPSNVLVTLYDGEAVPKVIDFGLAKALEHTTKLTDKTMFTEFGKVVGTVQYMSPEQAEMNALDVDTRTDIYSLGVMLYELLTGTTPLDKETIGKNAILQILAMIKEKEPPRPSHRLSTSKGTLTGISEQRKINPGKLQQILRGELDWVVMKALEKDRRRRYETAGEFAHDIRRYLADEAVTAKPPSAMYRVTKFVKRHRKTAVAVTTIFVLLIAGITGTTWFAYQANKSALSEKRLRKLADQKSKDAQAAEKTAKHNAKLSDQTRKKAERFLYINQINTAQREFERFNLPEAQAQLNACPEHLRGWEYDYLLTKFNSGRRDLIANKVPLNCAAIGADQKYIAVGNTGGTINLFNTETARSIPLQISKDFRVRDLAFGSPGNQLVCIGGKIEDFQSPGDGPGVFQERYSGLLSVWDLKTRDKKLDLPIADLLPNCVALSPDGTQTAIGFRDGSIKVFDIESQKELLSKRLGRQPLTDICYSTNGNTIITSSGYRNPTYNSANSIKVCDAKSGTVEIELKWSFTFS